MSRSPNICFLNTEGTNCNLDMAVAFEQAGAPAQSLHQVHINELRAGTHDLSRDQILILSGGFANGDDIRAGARFGAELREEFADELNAFSKAGKLILGVCNGFQILTETGLLPYGDVDTTRSKGVSLTGNNIGKFDCRWGFLGVAPNSACSFMNQEVLGEQIELPWAHAEGRAILDANFGDEVSLAQRGLITVRYVDQQGKPGYELPVSPNGSQGAIAGICNEEGNIAALMPHPERFIFAYQHPEYSRNKVNNQVIPPAGLPIFKAMLEVAQSL